MITTEDIVRVARSWQGTPYKHQHSKKGLGADCLGFIMGVYEEVVGPHGAIVPPYSADWDEVSCREDLLNAAKRYLIEKKDTTIGPGDVLVFRMFPGGVAKHCAIATEPDRMIHAYQSICVTESYIVPWWRKKVAAVFKFPEVG